MDRKATIANARTMLDAAERDGRIGFMLISVLQIGEQFHTSTAGCTSPDDLMAMIFELVHVARNSVDPESTAAAFLKAVDEAALAGGAERHIRVGGLN